MSHENWQSIWARRGTSDASGLSLEELLRLDGFDSGAACIDPQDWRSYAQDLANRLNIREGQSVFEIGCGAGAFLAALSETRSIVVGGIDYAEGLIGNARQALPQGSFQVGDAEALEPAPPAHHVIANSVFQYFPLGKAGNILQRMLSKAAMTVAVLDIPNRETQAECEAVRRAALPEAEYERKYAGLEHTYFDRDWFACQVNPDEWRCETIDGFIPNYTQNQFRFAALYRRVTPLITPTERI
ncbi:methyltransferase domain-containing protein [uncultured Dechloromonas sp.]|uniref:methyltransferase domain-containing protein n=1 Tax=uncultured Dechloromonas sp. TaxID=171719 RepID=UPI0025CC333C|nr:methyltransferase domain-containing protein [uncultured Dechloromonas sp.]